VSEVASIGKVVELMRRAVVVGVCVFYRSSTEEVDGCVRRKNEKKKKMREKKRKKQKKKKKKKKERKDKNNRSAERWTNDSLYKSPKHFLFFRMSIERGVDISELRNYINYLQGGLRRSMGYIKRKILCFHFGNAPYLVFIRGNSSSPKDCCK